VAASYDRAAICHEIGGQHAFGKHSLRAFAIGGARLALSSRGTYLVFGAARACRLLMRAYERC
jgi:hypothetical protein